MNFSSNRLNSELSVNGSVASFDEASSNDDLKELEKMIQFKKPPPDPYDLCIFAAAKDILKNSIATIPMLSLLSLRVRVRVGEGVRVRVRVRV